MSVEPGEADAEERPDTWEWLAGVLDSDLASVGEAVLASPSRAQAELVVPLSNRSATISTFRRHHDDRTLRDRLTAMGARTVAATGLLPRLVGERTVLAGSALLDEVARSIGLGAYTTAISLGPPRRNRKPVAMLFGSDGSLHAYVKIGWSPLTVELVDNEFESLTRVAGRLPEAIAAPAPLARVERSGVVAVAMSPLPWSLLRRRPLSERDVGALARCLGVERLAVGDLTWLNEPAFGERTDEVETSLREAVAAVATIHEDVAIDVGLWHGDLNPWNTVSTAASTGVLDWEFSGLQRPLDQDLFHLQFERLRRTGDADRAVVLAALLDAHAHPPNETERVRLDLYLADLAIRESRLSGQGWDGPMSGYRRPLTEAIERRLQP